MICKVESCAAEALSLGFCSSHYQSWRIYDDPLVSRYKQSRSMRKCTIAGCNKPHRARGYCGQHYVAWQNHGDPTGYSERSPNSYVIDGQMVTMDLRDKSGKVTATTTFNKRHLEKVMKYKWHLAKRQDKYQFVGSSNRSGYILLHRLILPVPEGFEVDHKDRNPRNNLDSNLRPCKRSENMSNSRYAVGKSGYIGVHVDNGNKNRKYRPCISVDRTLIKLEAFTDPADAAHVRDQLAMQLHGEFAILNFEY
jgi:hypothetical protein